MNYWILGLGAVAQCFLKLLCANESIDASHVYCIEPDCKKVSIFVKLGFIKKNFICNALNRYNYATVLQSLIPKDYCIDFSSLTNSKDLLVFCAKKKVHYLSVADTFWKDESENFGASHMDYLNIISSFPNNPTSIIQFGMNPGLVSSFAKQSIKMLWSINTLTESKNAIKQQDEFCIAKKASILNINKICICDWDMQHSNLNIEKSTIYSTWNIDAFVNEATTRPEYPAGIPNDDNMDEIVDFNLNYRRKNVPAYAAMHELVSPINSTNGFIMTHEETYSIAHYLSYRESDKITYRPEVIFVYKPCNESIFSIKNLLKAGFDRLDSFQKHILVPREIISGGEYVGVTLYQNDIPIFYFGNDCEKSGIEGSNITVFQVAVSCFAALKYIETHADFGILFPEDVDDDFIIDIVRQFMRLNYGFIKKA